MGSTNFQLIDQTLTNLESDTNYTTDPLRLNGAALGNLLPPATWNKMMYQLSAMCTGLATMLSNKGYTIIDEPFTNLVAVLMNIKTSADFPASVVVVPYATSITFNAAQASEFDLTLTGNVAASSLINTSNGQYVTFIVSQDSVGNRSFAWPASVTNPGPICQLANSTSIQQFVVRPSGTTGAGQILPMGGMIWITAGGLLLPQSSTVVMISSTGTVSNSISYNLTEEVNTASGPITRTLYSAIGYNGARIRFKNVGSQTDVVTLNTVAAQTIDGFLNYTVNPYWDIDVESDGSNWIIV